MNYIFQTVWTQVRLLRSSLISVHSVCIRDILYINSAVNFKIIKTAFVLLNNLHALLLNAFLAYIANSMDKSQIRPMSSLIKVHSVCLCD